MCALVGIVGRIISLVELLVCRSVGDKPLPQPTLNYFSLTLRKTKCGNILFPILLAGYLYQRAPTLYTASFSPLGRECDGALGLDNFMTWPGNKLAMETEMTFAWSPSSKTIISCVLHKHLAWSWLMRNSPDRHNKYMLNSCEIDMKHMCRTY